MQFYLAFSSLVLAFSFIFNSSLRQVGAEAAGSAGSWASAVRAAGQEGRE